MPRDARGWRAHLPYLGVFLLALGVLIVTVAVTGDDDGDDPDGPTSTTATDRGDGADPGRTADPELERALLRLDDLPEGWSEQETAGQLSELCGGRDPLAERPPNALSQSGFTRGEQGPVLSNVVADYDSDDDAEALLDAVRTMVADCGEYETDSGTFRISETSAPGIGDETVAAVLTGETPLGDLEGRILYVRVGDRIAAVALAGLDGIDAALVEDATETVADRL